MHAMRDVTYFSPDPIAPGTHGGSNMLDEPLPPLWGKVGMGGAAARSSRRMPDNSWRGSKRCVVRSDQPSCGGTPHPASPKLTSFAKAPHPSPTRGEETFSLVRRLRPPLPPRHVFGIGEA